MKKKLKQQKYTKDYNQKKSEKIFENGFTKMI